MSTVKSERIHLLQPDEVIPGDMSTTLWRWCLRNGWTFVPDPKGGEAFVDPRCAAAFCSPGIGYRSALNTTLAGVPRYTGGTVRISEVMRLRTEVMPEVKPEIASKSRTKKPPAR